MSGVPIFQQGTVLNASTLNAAFAQAATSVVLTAPGPIGTLTPSVGAFTTLSATTSLALPGGTATGFGWAPGNVPPPLENFNSTGNPGWHVPARLVWQRTSTAATDFADIQLNRTTAFSGGTVATQLNAALRITTTIGAGDNTQEYGLISQTVNNGTGSGLGYGAFIIAQKQANASAFTVGANISSRDFNTTGGSSASGAGVVGLELSTGGSKADDAVNAQAFGGRGIRVGLHLSGVANASDTTQAEYAHGIWFGINDTNNSGSANANWDQAIGFLLNTQVRTVVDTRGAIAPTGSTDPVWAMTMTAGHGVDFNGSASLIANPGGRWLYYDSGLGKLFYMNGATKLWSVDNSGNVRALGTFTGSVAP